MVLPGAHEGNHMKCSLHVFLVLSWMLPWCYCVYLYDCVCVCVCVCVLVSQGVMCWMLWCSRRHLVLYLESMDVLYVTCTCFLFLILSYLCLLVLPLLLLLLLPLLGRPWYNTREVRCGHQHSVLCPGPHCLWHHGHSCAMCGVLEDKQYWPRHLHWTRQGWRVSILFYLCNYLIGIN